MPVPLTYPGVYVQEVPSGVRTIVGVSTSTTLFVGSSSDGPINAPVLCQNYSEFVRNFSDDISSDHHLPRYVKLFFLNGGTQAWVMRIASGATAAKVTLKSEAAVNVLTLTASNQGDSGNLIRAVVDYNTDRPEASFNLTVYRLGLDTSGTLVQKDIEVWRNLSMDPSSSLFVTSVLKQNSQLVTAALAVAPAAHDGVSLGAQAIEYNNTVPANLPKAVAALLGKNRNFQISVGGRRFVTVNLPDFSTLADKAAMVNAITSAIDGAYTTVGIQSVGKEVAPLFSDVPGIVGPPQVALFRITATKKDVTVLSAPVDDAAAPLMLGTAQGGLEIGPFAALRPAATDTTLSGNVDPTKLADLFPKLYALTHSQLNTLTVDGLAAIPLPFTPLTGADPLWKNSTSQPPTSDGLIVRLRAAVQSINERAATDPLFPYRAELWGYRLALRRTAGGDNAMAATAVAADPLLASKAILNVRAYSMGSGSVGFQAQPVSGTNGQAPKSSDYDDAYLVVDREVDIFNLLVLPPDQTGSDMTPLWGDASVFCDQRRAFLLMDAPLNWDSYQNAAAKVPALRVGLVKDHASVYYPRVIVDEDGIQQPVGPSGAIAGLMARIDSSRGVWKSPAGVEADLRGVIGIERRFSDAENGVLNPRAINTIRIFPNGIVNWGARTMDGDDTFQSDYRYVPVRRLALFIEESLYRGLKWVVFEPNDEPLWAQIRLNVGSFMNGLFRQGAFQGLRPKDAYFVRCDAETTTQDDRNRGVVNIWVGFAPLKPAEFVVLYLQQMAGQIQV